MARLIIRNTPNQTGSQPSSRTTGRKIGSEMNMIVTASMNMPAISRITAITSMIVQGDDDSASSPSE